MSGRPTIGDWHYDDEDGERTRYDAAGLPAATVYRSAYEERGTGWYRRPHLPPAMVDEVDIPTAMATCDRGLAEWAEMTTPAPGKDRQATIAAAIDAGVDALQQGGFGLPDSAATRDMVATVVIATLDTVVDSVPGLLTAHAPSEDIPPLPPGFTGKRGKVIGEARDGAHVVRLVEYAFPDGSRVPYVELHETHDGSRPGRVIERYDLEILPVCLGLHMAHTGSADPLPAEDKARHVTWLRQRLAEWQPSHAKWERFDEAVRALIMATLDEVAPMPLDVLTPEEQDLVIASIPPQAGLTRDGERVIAAAELRRSEGRTRMECLKCHQWSTYGTSCIGPCVGSDWKGVGRKDPAHDWQNVPWPEDDMPRLAVVEDRTTAQLVADGDWRPKVGERVIATRAPGRDSLFMLWALDARETCSGIGGVVREEDDCDGLSFRVEHANGEFAWWAADELRPIYVT